MRGRLDQLLSKIRTPDGEINPWVIAVTVTLATFMEVLDTSIANVALPHIAGNLSAGVDESTWVLTSYLVSNAIVLPLSGWFSSLIGRKRFYMLCVGLFTVSSFLCGLAPNLGALVFFRVLQGAGGGGLQPSEQAILSDTFAPAKRGMAFAVYGVAVVVAPTLGPTLGGWITDNYSWRWIFYINIPVGILSLLLTSMLIKDPPYMQRRSFRSGLRIDYIGIGLISLGLGSLQIVLDKGQREDWFDSNFIRTFGVLALACLVAAVIWELRQRDPVVDLRMLRERNFMLATSTMFFLGFVLYASTVLLPQMLQTLLGYPATTAGMALSPGGLVIMAMMPVVGFLVSRVEARWLIIFGLFVGALSLFWMSHWNLGIDFRSAVYARMLQSFGLAFLFIPINVSAFAFVPREKTNNATGLINLARNIGASVGIATVTTLLERRSQVHHQILGSHVNSLSPAYQSMVTGTSERLMAQGAGSVQATSQAHGLLANLLNRQSAMLGFVDNFWLLGWVFVAVIPLMFLMKRAKPQAGSAPVH
jgi:MFS transporter, DHA2 family, multidrug resistance protein